MVFAACLAASGCDDADPPAQAGHAKKVIVIARSAPIRHGDKIVAYAKEDALLAEVERRGDWVAVSFTLQGKRMVGWMDRRDVMAVFDSPGYPLDAEREFAHAKGRDFFE